MPSSRPVLCIRNARKRYGNVRPLRGVTLELFPGELLGFLGPNGAGKTTLIRCLAGRCKLDRGTIEFAGAGKLGDILGVVPQNIAVYEDLSAEQNLYAFGKLQAIGRMRLRDRVEMALHWSNLADRRHHLVKTFSGGMKRRLNIACSVLHRPRILLLDEPTVGVDPQSRERIYDMLQELRHEGTAILLTTHQLDEAQHRCDRIAIVDQGCVVKTGTFEALVSETVGHHQRLNVRFHGVPSARPPKLTMHANGTSGSCEMSSIATELPAVLSTLQACGEPVEHVVLQRPTLQDVFLHLTGKELRE